MPGKLHFFLFPILMHNLVSSPSLYAFYKLMSSSTSCRREELISKTLAWEVPLKHSDPKYNLRLRTGGIWQGGIPPSLWGQGATQLLWCILKQDFPNSI